MTGTSLLFGAEHPVVRLAEVPPACFVDLNLDVVVEEILKGREEYELAPYFWTPLASVGDVFFRHDVMRDLKQLFHRDIVSSFRMAMIAVRTGLKDAAKMYYEFDREVATLDTIDTYCRGVLDLHKSLSFSPPSSRGLIRFREFLSSYVASTGFQELLAELARLREEFSLAEYCVFIQGDRVTISRFERQADETLEVLRLLDQVSGKATGNVGIEPNKSLGMTHVEAQIVERVARLFPDPFRHLTEFCRRYRDFLHAQIAAFDREVQFYVAYLSFTERLERVRGTTFQLPSVLDHAKDTVIKGAFDIALANQLAKEDGKSVVTNDFQLRGKERLAVISGPNQGGKSTFGRALSQTYFLASLGCAVPARLAAVPLIDHVFTHFEVGESVHSLQGKLYNDLTRIKGIMDAATERSVILLNEIFASTTSTDALQLARQVFALISTEGSICICVTFLDELATFDQDTVSYRALVDESDPRIRTFRLVRELPSGPSYAMQLAELHGVTYEALSKRLAA